MNSIKYKTNSFVKFLPFVLFFVLGTFFLWKFTNHIFFYHEKSSLFLVSFTFLQEHLNQPGGFLVYLGKLQSTFYYYPLLGAIILVAEICGIIYLLQKIGEIINSRNVYVLPFLIGAILFFLHTNYQYQAFNTLGVFIQLVLFLGVIRFVKQKYLWFVVCFTPIIYLLFGSFSFMFLLLFSTFLFLNKEWLKIVVSWVLCVLLFFIGKEFLFFQTIETLLTNPFSVQEIGGQIQLFIVVLAVIILFPFLAKINGITIKNIRLIELSPIVTLVVFVFLLVPRIDKKNSQYFKVEQLFYAQKYDELIELNTKEQSTNMLTAFLNNVALAETGELTESFFTFPQSPDGRTLFLKWEIISEVLKRGGYFYYSTGMINEAQRWAYEYMVMEGNSPEALKMMIKTDLIKGKYKIAEKYIAFLEKSVFYRKEAKEFRKLLFNNEAVAAHPELGKKQKLDTKQDFFVQTENPAINLDYIIEADSTNLAAIEYKLAWLMLQKDMAGVVNMLPIMEKAGYKRIPKNVEEVVASYKLMRVGEMPELKYLKVNPKTEQRFQQFYKIFQENRNNKQQAQGALAQEFLHTYWYYVFFR